MAESERRRKYQYNRVLIETARVLDPQFDDAVVFLSGAQIEMLRNVTQYLSRLDTYVDEYNPGYYLTPDTADYDEVLAIVADLEEVLMGNLNTIWGYVDTYAKANTSTTTSLGEKTRLTASPPAGYIYVVTAIAAVFTSGLVSRTQIDLHIDGTDFEILSADDPDIGVPLAVQGFFPLKFGEYIIARFEVTAQPCAVALRATGYQMKVPE